MQTMYRKLSQPQKRILEMEGFAGGSIANICGSMLIDGEADVETIEQSLNELLRINPALRTRLSSSREGTFQHVTPHGNQHFEILELENSYELETYGTSFARIPIPRDGVLSDIKIVVLPNAYGFLIKVHHIIGDAWSLALFCRQFAALMNGDSVEAYSYDEFLDKNEDYLESDRFRRDREYYTDLYSKCDTPFLLAPNQVESYKAVRHTLEIDSSLWNTAISYSGNTQVSLPTILLFALTVSIGKLRMNPEKLYIGMAVLNRFGKRDKETFGMFVNTIPLLAEIDWTASCKENLGVLKKSILVAFHHQRCNYGDALQAIRHEFGFEGTLFDVEFSYQNAQVADPSATTAWYSNGMQTETLQVHAEDRDARGGLRIHYDYLPDRISQEEIETIHMCIVQFLTHLFEDDGTSVGTISVMDESATRRVLHELSGSGESSTTDPLVMESFALQVASTPSKVAVIAADRKMTYAELDLESDKIAAFLIDHGIKKGDVVGILLNRRSWLVSSILGALKAGAAYLPLDPNYPKERIDSLIADASATLCISQENIGEAMAWNPSHCHVDLRPEDAFCALHTSGSTGKPKVTVLTHGNVACFANGNSKFWDNADTVVSTTTQTFDAFQMESVILISQGKCLVLASEDDIYDQAKFQRLFDHSNRNLLFSTPSKIDNYIDSTEDFSYLKTISTFIIGGEVFSARLLDKIKLASPSSNIFNIYGPTETTICVTADKLCTGKKDISIGRPLCGCNIYVLDRFLQPVPIGGEGEVCIGGTCVGLGYPGMPQLTKEKFIPNMFGQGVMYRTGDLARWRPNGKLEFIGRGDNQVKLRGLRIELGEVERVFDSIEGVKTAAVIMRGDMHKFLAAFYTGEEQPTQDMRVELLSKLPRYMVPSVITHLDVMPLTPSGKIDRQLLAAVHMDTADNIRATYIAPQTELQRRLCALFSQVLDVQDIGIDDDFFDLGGDSLHAMELIAAGNSEGVHFSLQQLYDTPTVRGLTEADDRQFRSSSLEEKITIAERVLHSDSSEDSQYLRQCDVGNIMLAGATGFLGCHLLARYLDSYKGVAYCLVRPGDEEGAREHLMSTMDYYFGNRFRECTRVVVVPASLERTGLGIDSSSLRNLMLKVDTIINCAADVRHFARWEDVQGVNVNLPQRLVHYAREYGKRLLHVSTLSVSGGIIDESDMARSDLSDHKRISFDESSLYIGQTLNNVYVRSKFEAECAVLSGVSNGVDGSIARMGNLMPRRSDGVFQYNYETNAFMDRIRALITLGCAPESLMELPVDLTPVDDAAEAIFTLMCSPTPNRVFHVFNPQTLTMGELVELIRDAGYPIRIVNDDHFLNRLSKEFENGDRRVGVAFARDMDERGRIILSTRIDISCKTTADLLAKQGFSWRKADATYVASFLHRLQSKGYIKGFGEA